VTKNMKFDFPYQVREKLEQVMMQEWIRLSKPGTWWKGEERNAIAQEVRKARNCNLCSQRKKALSLYLMKEEHEAAPLLTATVVDTIHRIVTDNGRLSEDWYKKVLSSGLTEYHFVEIVGIIAAVMAIDTFNEAIGASLPDFSCSK
jgi:hypothetical protein